ncbi:hypothetical protein FB45DRAFT_919328 [Roridomyces roridus]|uniref:Uncharacterized protein n=1 Tax=Roridomyces roridus TaxID=1738132 RepID=A0AAD7BS73_9AGAR|nr:hypothetical protein FB45DRAFT_919328 [Roridomyces roridus]
MSPVPRLAKCTLLYRTTCWMNISKMLDTLCLLSQAWAGPSLRVWTTCLRPLNWVPATLKIRNTSPSVERLCSLLRAGSSSTSTQLAVWTRECIGSLSLRFRKAASCRSASSRRNWMNWLAASFGFLQSRRMSSS